MIATSKLIHQPRMLKIDFDKSKIIDIAQISYAIKLSSGLVVYLNGANENEQTSHS